MYPRTGNGTVPVPYGTVRYRTVRYHTGNTAVVRYMYGTAPYGTITRRHVVLLKTATIYAAMKETFIYVDFSTLRNCRCWPIDHRVAMDILFAYLKLGMPPGFHDWLWEGLSRSSPTVPPAKGPGPGYTGARSSPRHGCSATAGPPYLFFPRDWLP